MKDAETNQKDSFELTFMKRFIQKTGALDFIRTRISRRLAGRPQELEVLLKIAGQSHIHNQQNQAQYNPHIFNQLSSDPTIDVIGSEPLPADTLLSMSEGQKTRFNGQPYELLFQHYQQHYDGVYTIMQRTPFFSLCNITQLDDWMSDVEESETTIYRRFAVLLDCVFRIRIGECVAKSGKDTMIILQALTGSFSNYYQPKIYGSKIDLIAATRHDGEQYDLCSNEWKREGVLDSVLLKQQAKHLRTNAAILSKLIKLGFSNSMIAMDWAEEGNMLVNMATQVDNQPK
ncbi:hypothetical protein INT45_003257 [Circinella minor]|uniref:Uncharacterized protein n=1 Tax=Circinella minor TaxID=1195481 RepID=A0A8H7SB69_9FUNG|nr:hypothetical protein INT45_003257 [Circinella minor]